MNKDFPSLSRNPSRIITNFIPEIYLSKCGFRVAIPRRLFIRDWHLIYRCLNESDYRTLRDFFKNQIDSFNWTNPTNNITYRVILKEGTFSSFLREGDYWDVEFDLREVHNERSFEE